MNANQLWAGNDYAYASAGKPRGVDFVYHAERVRVIRVLQEKDWGSERARTVVEVHALNPDGSNKTSHAGTDLVRKIRARDIFMRWDEYEDEKRYRDEQREKIERERQEKQAKAEAERNKLIEALETKGIERAAVSSVTDYSVQINRATLESWLGLDA